MFEWERSFGCRKRQVKCEGKRWEIKLLRCHIHPEILSRQITQCQNLTKSCEDRPAHTFPSYFSLCTNRKKISASSSKGPQGRDPVWHKHTSMFLYRLNNYFILYGGFHYWILSIDFGLDFCIKPEPLCFCWLLLSTASTHTLKTIHDSVWYTQAAIWKINSCSSGWQQLFKPWLNWLMEEAILCIC